MPNFLTVKVLAWIAGALGVVIIGMAALLWAAGVRIDDVKNARDKAQNELAQAVKTIKGQADALKECSDRTDKLAAEGVKRQAASDAAVAKAQQEARRYQEANKRRAALLAGPTPKGAGCKEALAEIRK